MDKKTSTVIQYVLVVILAVVITLIIHHIMTRSDLNIEESFAPDMTYTDNPLMGFAPDASNDGLCDKTDLVFITVTFADWEPREGFYDTQSLEKKYNIDRWKRENKHAVIRFMCDVPGKNDHMDIPGWLYDITDKGTHYSTSIGKGFSPDYADADFIKYHRKAIEELAKYCNSDHFVTFVELGSLGHWGEWHASDSAGNSLMPSEEICNEYAGLYSDNFVNAALLTRRNYEFAVNGNMGFYNDMVGMEEDTKEWLSWFEKGGSQETVGADLKLMPISDYGRLRPVGGEFTSALSMDDLMTDDLGDVLALISASNMTFIGPNVPDLTDEEISLAVDSVNKRLGYRLYVSNIKSRYDFSKEEMELELTFKNAGRAGVFFDWPVTIYIFDANREKIFWEGLNIDLRDINRDGEVKAISHIPVTQDMRDEFYIGVSITDYDGNDFIKLAIDSQDTKEMIDNVQLIYHYIDKDM